MIRRLFAVVLLACGGHESQPPPQATLPQQQAPADAGPTSIVGDTIGEEPQRVHDAGAGTLPRDVIQKVVRAGLPRAKHCYQKALQSDPNLKGRVATRFVIDPTGHVSSAITTSETTMPDQDVVMCVLGVFKSLQFPQPDGGGSVTVVYPFVFQAADADD